MSFMLDPHGSLQGWLHDILNAPGLRKDDVPLVPLLGALILAAAVVGTALMRKMDRSVSGKLKDEREARRIKREAEALKYQ